MESLLVTRRQQIVTVAMARGKVNAVNQTMTDEISSTFHDLASDTSVDAVILTGQGRFFSFGFDIPEMYDYPIDRFGKFVRSFCRFYRELFVFPKPVVAAVNGHAIAGGCILALACDQRLMVREGAKMSLNEVTFGATLFAGTVEMLRYTAGNRRAEQVLLSGDMFDGPRALELGLADQLTGPEDLLEIAHTRAVELSRHGGRAYRSLKNHLKGPIADSWMLREEASIDEWLRIWYLPETREKTKGIQIR